MPTSFQWITPLLIENVYFADTSVKGHTHWHEPRSRNPKSSENMSQDPEPLVLWKHEPMPKKPLVLWKHESRSKNHRSSENISQDPEPLVLWKREPKPKKPLVLWKHGPRSKNPRSSENMSQDPKILGLLKTWAKIPNLWSSETHD